MVKQLKIIYIAITVLFFISNLTAKSVTTSQINYEKSLNIVTDHTNNIMWQDDDEVTHYLETFETAQVYCDTLILNGYIDWRVPTIYEIQKIVDVNNENGLNAQFKFLQSKIYNTTTTFAEDKNMMVVVDFETSKTTLTNKHDKNYVRCVREIK